MLPQYLLYKHIMKKKEEKEEQKRQKKEQEAKKKKMQAWFIILKLFFRWNDMWLVFGTPHLHEKGPEFDFLSPRKDQAIRSPWKGVDSKWSGYEIKYMIKLTSLFYWVASTFYQASGRPL